MCPLSRSNFAFVALSNRSVASARVVLLLFFRVLAVATGTTHTLAGMIPIGNIGGHPIPKVFGSSGDRRPTPKAFASQRRKADFRLPFRDGTLRSTPGRCLLSALVTLVAPEPERDFPSSKSSARPLPGCLRLMKAPCHHCEGA